MSELFGNDKHALHANRRRGAHEIEFPTSIRAHETAQHLKGLNVISFVR